MKPVPCKVASLACALFVLSGTIVDAVAADNALKLTPTKNADGSLGLSVSMPGAASAKQAAPLRVSLWEKQDDADSKRQSAAAQDSADMRCPNPAQWRFEKSPDPLTKGGLKRNDGTLRLDGDFAKGKRYVAAACPVALAGAVEMRLQVKTNQNRLLVRIVDATGQNHQHSFDVIPDGTQELIIPLVAAKEKNFWDGAKDGVLHTPLKQVKLLVARDTLDSDKDLGFCEFSDVRLLGPEAVKAQPVNPATAPVTLQGGYASLRGAGGEWLGTGVLKTPKGAALEFTDRWTVGKNTLRLRREVRVKGNAPGGFTSVASLQLVDAQPWPKMEWFAPGMIYGNFDHMRDNSFGSGNYYKPGDYTVWIREDRMPAPLLAARMPAGGSFAVLNSAPDSATTAAEGQGFSREPMTDARFRFGAIVAEERPEGTTLGYAVPGSEGTLSYGRKTGAGPEVEQKWRHRYNPLSDNFVQRYEVSFWFGKTKDTNDLVARSWRWAWDELEPRVNPQDIETMRASMVDVLNQNYIEIDDRAGVQFLALAVPGGKPHPNPKVILGFTGYALGSAEMMLVEANRNPDSERGRLLRRNAEKAIESFLRMPINPPLTEGFLLKSGGAALSTWPSGRKVTEAQSIYLRSFCDDMKSLMRAYEREQKAGRTRAEWLAWVRKFGDWLLTQEQPGGGFPRSWHALSGKLYSASTTGTFNVVPFYAQLYRVTGHKPYLDAALRSGEFAWNTGHGRARFTGGTIDNPDVIDKEAATIALEGYLVLHHITRDQKWLDRARIAADIAETWMYIWNVPMPEDADNEKLHWKRGVPTTGIQLIATGHSLNDAYMCWDVESYARLARETGDSHYMDVARILLHNTKAMVGTPEDHRGTLGPGWQQEHYCFTLTRGIGRHREWLPWVTVSHLRGINDLIDYDPELYRQLAGE
ncbi:hypothetical protein [Ereboglobus luteus]|uniref:hypothetical protein n=1 Tax=Ereboglobus luteus TaxID=1796921 RepID=UPI0012601521|nr:hypothetical protein [Ereboglobus luteus]